jgi:hypothetical protein
VLDHELQLKADSNNVICIYLRICFFFFQ